MNQRLLLRLEVFLDERIVKTQSISGGDISKTYKIETPNKSFFLKLNTNVNTTCMFQAEANGLELIRNTNTIKTPKVIALGTFENTSFLLLEYIESKSASTQDFETLGNQLAKLHQCTSSTFGLNHNNFIGSLAQSNKPHDSWLDFYIHERLLPQLKMANQKRLLSDSECPSPQDIKKVLQPLSEGVNPALLHGDLWSGNYLISIDGTPYLIDPAAYYGHHEVDIAMSQLFGGFDNAFYNSYFSTIPQDKNTATRIELYQLYYLLVHLNLFGSSYHQSVISILRKYF